MSTEAETIPAPVVSSSIVTRSALILDVLSAAPGPLGFSEIVARARLPKSSVHRLLAILLGEDLIGFDARQATYDVGPRLLGWAARAFRRGGLADLAEAPMQELVTRTGFNVALSVLDANSVLYLRAIDAGPAFRLAPRVGEFSPAHASASGKVLLAHLRPPVRTATLASLPLDKLTETTIVDAEALALELAGVCEQGYAICDREEFLQVIGVAAPIFDINQDVVGALSLWSANLRDGIGDLLVCTDALCVATGDLSRRLGCNGQGNKVG